MKQICGTSTAYIKIHSKIEINKDKLDCYNARFFYDYDRQQDDEDELYRYEYFFELSDEYDNIPASQLEFQQDCRSVLKHLNETVGICNYYITNMSGVYLP